MDKQSFLHSLQTKDNGKEDVDWHITSSKNTEQNYVEKTLSYASVVKFGNQKKQTPITNFSQSKKIKDMTPDEK